MILTITGADFSGANIGTNDSVRVSVSVNSAALSTAHGIPDFVDKGVSVSWTITLKEGYTFGSVDVSMEGGGSITKSISGSTLTITSSNVTGKITINVPTSGGEVVDPEPEEPGTSRLPSEYQEVEYLKTNETQYFVLDEVSSNVIYEIKFRSDKLTSADGLIGCYSSTAEANRSQIRISSQKDNAEKTYDGIEFMYGGEGSVEKTNVATTQISLDYWTTPNILKVDANKMYWNGTLKVTRTAFTSNTLATPFTLFAQNNNNAGSTSPGFGRQAVVECYYVKIQDTSKSINKELIPCYRKSDNVIGFYDIIGGTFITPTSGDITEKGPNV